MATIPDPQIAKDRLAAIDLSWIVVKFVRDYGYEASDAFRAVDLYRHVLELAIEHPGQALLPPTGADRAWRAHILNTQRYREDCLSVFGDFMHHDPDDFEQEAFRTSWEFTRMRLSARFGVDLAPEEAEGAPSFEPDETVMRSLLVSPT
jgi:hypothetical protein